ncbi:MAG: 3-deoxy-D-manno-octulosonic acid transferase [Betaproteobacteria bacterium]|nr:3-deoxy-D-manno-octulosonic acid transferase [Betaproteobacteria bacterium]NBS22054.1 3-deoxy-D-manno-octulosonic acid transferase [Betaproteobacteria bacterium]NBT65765.1 3-deoxy-D-manno-octulosonic acid transferase [Betaproteobacteria bacterium]NCU99381.1 3-deoxy-D-manno-octulosonic acid transferase [Betaproteobacteria bacterium]NCW32061.1 3-deoxy-D-manno-octulosonic acid transferase [Betaproteobacteria bacterium]
MLPASWAGGDCAGDVVDRAIGLSQAMKPLSLASRLALEVYSLLWLLLSPALLAYLLYRSLKQPAYSKHLSERFGLRFPAFDGASDSHHRSALGGISGSHHQSAPGGASDLHQHLRAGGELRANDKRPLIWVHAVSLGETNAAGSLLRAIKQDYPKHRLLLTHGTPTGREAGNSLLKSIGYADHQSLQLYLPYDNRWAVDRFFDHYRPDIGLIIETEVWPMLMQRASAFNISMILISARLSEKSLAKARRYQGLIQPALLAFEAILCQTDADLMRIRKLAPDVQGEVCGNLKFDLELPQDLLNTGLAWRDEADLRAPGLASSGKEDSASEKPLLQRSWLVAASTREGEEALLLKQWLGLAPRETMKIVMVIVPRHPQRFEQVAELLDQCCEGRWIRRSDPLFPAVDPSVCVILGDSLGEMAAWYALADLVVMGGSLIDTGSQNLIEACAAGRPVVLGPSVYNFAQAASEALECGAAIQCESERVLSAALDLLADRKNLAAMGQKAQRFVLAHQGASQRVMVAVGKHLESVRPIAV